MAPPSQPQHHQHQQQQHRRKPGCGDDVGAAAVAADGDEDPSRPSAEAAVKRETELFSNLNDSQLKNLLDEAISYKSPKDREGKSELFNNLLTDAENELRNARATSASGPETVRHYNKRAATKRHRGDRAHGRKASSVSENHLTHSGSLNNLTEEDLYLEGASRQRPKKTVSARQTEGGSLPCNVNVGAFHQFREQQQQQQQQHQGSKPPTSSEKKAVAAMTGETSATTAAAMTRASEEADVIENIAGFSAKGKKSQKGNSVDDRIPVSVLEHLPTLEASDYAKKPSSETTAISNSFLPSNAGGLPFAVRTEKRVVASSSATAAQSAVATVDENCNAVPTSGSASAASASNNNGNSNNGAGQQQSPATGGAADGRKIKSKKRPMEKNVTVFTASNIDGHRGDIINDVDKLVDFIGGTEQSKQSKKPQQQQQQHHNPKKVSGGGTHPSSRTTTATSTPSVGKPSKAATATAARPTLKKCNSLEEISKTKIGEFEFLKENNSTNSTNNNNSNLERKENESNEENQVQVVLRSSSSNNKGNSNGGRERRSWGTSEYSEVLETTQPATPQVTTQTSSDFRVVTKKKKSRRAATLSTSSTGASVSSVSMASGTREHQRRGSLGRASSIVSGTIGNSTGSSNVGSSKPVAVSVPHSERSNDSSDADSVHSLPIDSERFTNDDEVAISYADIARNANNGNVLTVSNNDHNKVIVTEKNDNKKKVSNIEKEIISKVIINANNNNNNNNNNVNKVERQSSVEKEPAKKESLEKSVTNIINNYSQNFPSIVTGKNNNTTARNPIAEIQTWPAIPNNTAQRNNIRNTLSSKQPQQGPRNHLTTTPPRHNLNNKHQEPSAVPTATAANVFFDDNNVPINIPDVRSIEKQIKSQIRTSENVKNSAVQCNIIPNSRTNHNNTNNANNNNNINLSANCNINNNIINSNNVVNNHCIVPPAAVVATSSANPPRPAVVILKNQDSGGGEDVKGITFGFDIDRFLAPSKGEANAVNDFAARFVPPPRFEELQRKMCNMDGIVRFVGEEWDKVMKDMYDRPSHVRYYEGEP